MDVFLYSDKQDKRAVMGFELAILRDLHAKHPNIENAWIRSDNAGCYHNMRYSMSSVLSPTVLTTTRCAAYGFMSHGFCRTNLAFEFSAEYSV